LSPAANVLLVSAILLFLQFGLVLTIQNCLPKVLGADAQVKRAFSEGRLTDRRCVISSLILCFFKCSLACSQNFHLCQTLANERKYLNALDR